MPTLKNIDYRSLPISDYNRRYILWLLPQLDYYLDIYRRAICAALQDIGRPLEHTTVVDYGGGHGFLSVVAKEMGVSRVLYVDYNPDSAATVKAIAAAAGYGPDVVLTGDAATLRAWCEEHSVVPDAVLGMDVVEHIYRLDTFFADIFAINPAMRMVLTTASNPSNPRVVRRLHRIMKADELGSATRPGFRALRRQRLAEAYPDMSPADLDRWAAATQGLTYDDAVRAVGQQQGQGSGTAHRDATGACPLSRYNTCDPATGSWTERLLPLSEYRRLLQPFGARLTVANGRYNTRRHGFKAVATRLANGLLRCNAMRCMAPFIILNVNIPHTNKHHHAHLAN